MLMLSGFKAWCMKTVRQHIISTAKPKFFFNPLVLAEGQFALSFSTNLVWAALPASLLI